MIRVKLTTQHPQWPLIRQTPGLAGVWGDCQFHINDDIAECDVWVVFEGLLKSESTTCAVANRLLVTWEPPTFRSYNPRFLNQFPHVITCHPNLRHKSVEHAQQAHPWFIGKSYDELIHLSPPPKSRTLSIISSNKAFTSGHAQRLTFAQKLKDRLGDAVDLFGRGIRDFNDKWDVLAPYKYTIAMENCACDDWVTEKLPDCYLTYTFPFYWGAPNVTRYFDSKSFVAIDPADFDGTFRRIEQVLAQPDHYNQHLDALRAARVRYLDHLQLFPMLNSWIQTHYKPNAPRTSITLRPETPTEPGMWSRLKKSAKRIIKGS